MSASAILTSLSLTIFTPAFGKVWPSGRAMQRRDILTNRLFSTSEEMENSCEFYE